MFIQYPCGQILYGKAGKLMKYKLLIIILPIFLVVGISYGVDSTKPNTHNSNWIVQHGKSAQNNLSDCLMCHDERSEFISCHEDMAPRNHTTTFVNRTHGMEVRWKRSNCQVCHKSDYCDSCHETSYPLSHVGANFASGNQSETGSHCGSSCVLPSGSWTNTPSKNCIVCHKTRPETKQGPHALK